MYNLFKLELYKFKKQKLFKFLLLLIIAISFMSTFSSKPLSGKESFANASVDMIMLFVSAVFSSFYIGSDFSNRTIQTQISHGNSRFSIVIAKTLVVFIGSTIIMLLYPITVGVINTLRFGWGEPFIISSAIYILRVTLLSTIIYISVASGFAFIGFICKDLAKTICFSLAYPLILVMVVSTLAKVPFIGELILYLPIAQLGNIVVENVSVLNVMNILISAIITVTVVVSSTNVLFSKAEIK